jgi:DNA-binding response OmpR family regulator
MANKVLSLGQCAADNYVLRHFLASEFQAALVPVDTFPQALAELRQSPFALVLVNRILDANGAEGLDFITELKKDLVLANTPVMLVSNYQSAQEKALARGALPGFGKAQLDEPGTVERLKLLLAAVDRT